MDPRIELLAYVESVGGRRQAASILDLPYPTLSAICNGTRGISRAMAQRLEVASGGALKAERLVWVEAKAVA